MFLVSRIIRWFYKIYIRCRSISKITAIKLMYPKVKISYNSYLGANCIITCTNDSSVEILKSSIGSGSSIIAAHGGDIIIKNSFIGLNCMIAAREAIHIGSNCQIAEMVVIRDQNHNFGEPDKTITEQGFTSQAIIIEENVWLGAKATVTAGSIIAKNAVIGAHALVRGKLEANSLYVGTPAKKIKSF